MQVAGAVHQACEHYVTGSASVIFLVELNYFTMPVSTNTTTKYLTNLLKFVSSLNLISEYGSGSASIMASNSAQWLRDKLAEVFHRRGELRV